jgi:hypothetical protein
LFSSTAAVPAVLLGMSLFRVRVQFRTNSRSHMGKLRGRTCALWFAGSAVRRLANARLQWHVAVFVIAGRRRRSWTKCSSPLRSVFSLALALSLALSPQSAGSLPRDWLMRAHRQ